MRTRVVFAAICLLFPASCTDRTESVAFSADEMEALALVPEMELPPLQTERAERKLIQSGRLKVEVAELRDAIGAAEEMAEEFGGFVAGSNLDEGEQGSRTASLVLQVPAASFQPIVARFAEIGRVLSTSTRATDITREYLDVETRLAVKEQTVQRLQALLQRSGDLEDLLAVERELGRATEQLESLKGQIRYYDQQVALSELTITLVEPGAAIGPGAFEPIARAFREAVRVFAESVAALVYLVATLIPWLVVLALLWPALRRVRRGIRRKQAVDEDRVEEGI